MSRKLTYEEVRNYIESKGCKLISEEYINAQTKLEVQCKCGNIYKVNFNCFKSNNQTNCPECSNKTQWNFNTIKHFIEVESNSGCKLLSKEYIDVDSMLKIKCICGEDFNIPFYEFKNKNKRVCEKCRRINNRNKKRVDIFNDMKIFFETLGYQLITKEYVDAKTKLIFKDRDGFFYFSNFNHMKIYKNSNKFDISNPYTIQNIKLWCKLNNKPFELLSEEYEGNRNKLKWKCLKEECGEIFEKNWGDMSQNQGCPYCVGKQIGLSNCLATLRLDLAAEWHPTKNGDLTPYNITISSGRKVWWKCSKNPKHEWETSVANRNKGDNCPYCYGRYASEDYNLLVVNPKLCEEWDYEKNKKKPDEYCPNSEEKAWWVCKECGYNWKSTIGNRNKNIGCPECSKSNGEKRIKEILSKYNIFYDSQYIFNDLIGIGGGWLRFDVPIFYDKEKTKLKMLIEFDGEQHYKWIKGWMTKKDFNKLQYHDKLKNEYCQKHNIPLLRIKWFDYDNIEQILQKELNINNLKECVNQ
jgi:hypothetical protein